MLWCFTFHSCNIYESDIYFHGYWSHLVYAGWGETFFQLSRWYSAVATPSPASPLVCLPLQSRFTGTPLQIPVTESLDCFLLLSLFVESIICSHLRNNSPLASKLHLRWMVSIRHHRNCVQLVWRCSAFAFMPTLAAFTVFPEHFVHFSPCFPPQNSSGHSVMLDSDCYLQAT